jgi:hypothetical protein
MTADRTKSLGPILPEALYPRKVFQRLSGWQDGAFTEARRAGLKVRYLHGRSFILGQDAIDYVLSAGKTEKTTAKAGADA